MKNTATQIARTVLILLVLLIIPLGAHFASVVVKDNPEVSPKSAFIGSAEAKEALLTESSKLPLVSVSVFTKYGLYLLLLLFIISIVSYLSFKFKKDLHEKGK